MSVDDVSRLLIVLAGFDWVATAVIYIAAYHYREPALSERASTSVILSAVATIAALLGANRLGLLHIDSGLATVMLAGSLILVSAPQFIWTAGLALGKFR